MSKEQARELPRGIGIGLGRSGEPAPDLVDVLGRLALMHDDIKRKDAKIDQLTAWVKRMRRKDHMTGGRV